MPIMLAGRSPSSTRDSLLAHAQGCFSPYYIAQRSSVGLCRASRPHIAIMQVFKLQRKYPQLEQQELVSKRRALSGGRVGSDDATRGHADCVLLCRCIWCQLSSVSCFPSAISMLPMYIPTLTLVIWLAARQCTRHRRQGIRRSSAGHRVAGKGKGRHL